MQNIGLKNDTESTVKLDKVIYIYSIKNWSLENYGFIW